jgi:hypothetical protein
MVPAFRSWRLSAVVIAILACGGGGGGGIGGGRGDGLGAVVSRRTPVGSGPALRRAGIMTRTARTTAATSTTMIQPTARFI